MSNLYAQKKIPAYAQEAWFTSSGFNPSLSYSGPVKKGLHLSGDMEVFTTGLLKPQQSVLDEEMRSISLGLGAVIAYGFAIAGIEGRLGLSAGGLTSNYQGTLRETYPTLVPVNGQASGTYQGFTYGVNWRRLWQLEFWSKSFQASSQTEGFRGSTYGISLRYTLN